MSLFCECVHVQVHTTFQMSVLSFGASLLFHYCAAYPSWLACELPVDSPISASPLTWAVLRLQMWTSIWLFMWALGIGLKSLGLCNNWIYLLSHLPNFCVRFLGHGCECFLNKTGLPPEQESSAPVSDPNTEEILREHLWGQNSGLNCFFSYPTVHWLIEDSK